MNTYFLPDTYVAPDEEDVLLLEATKELQAIVERHARSASVPMTAMTTAERQAAIDAVNPYLEFELSQSEGIWQGLPIAASGNGAIITFDAEGNVLGIQETDSQDIILGIVTDVSAFPVPTLKTIIEARQNAEATPVSDVSPSAVLYLDEAQFHTPDGSGRMIIRDLSHVRVAVPLVYDMPIRITGGCIPS